MQEELFPIGRLSKISNISIDAIRYYDDIGLLKPAYISDDSGYRYYSNEQIEILARVRELKIFGFSLNEIKAMLLQDDTSLAEFYLNRYWSLLQEKDKLQLAIGKLTEKIKYQPEVRFMNKRILLIDDAAFMRQICTEILSKDGYEVVGEATDGMQGLEKYKSLQPDLVLLDIAMPEYDGKWALQKIKEYDANANIVMLSAVGHAQAVVDSFILGAKGFIVKPFQGDYLLSVLRGLFQDGHQPLNQALLSQIAAVADLSRENVLSQEIIDKILDAARTAKQPDAMPLAELAELIEALKSIGAVEKPSSVAVDETPALFRRIIQGQEKITSLLERLLDEKNGTND